MCSPGGSDEVIDFTKLPARPDKEVNLIRFQQAGDTEGGDLPMQAQVKEPRSAAAEQAIAAIQENNELRQNPIDPAFISILTTRLNDVLEKRRGSRSRSRSLSLRSAEIRGFMTGSVSPVFPSSPSDYGETPISSPADGAGAFDGKLSEPAQTVSLPPPLVNTKSSILSVTNPNIAGLVSSGATEACSDAAPRYGSSLQDARPAFTEPGRHERPYRVVSPRAHEKADPSATTHLRVLKNAFGRRRSQPNRSARPSKEVHSPRELEDSGLSAQPSSSTGPNTPGHMYQRSRTYSSMTLFSQASSAVQGLRRDRRPPASPPLQSIEKSAHNVKPLPNMLSPAETGRIARQGTDTGVSSTLIDETP